MGRLILLWLALFSLEALAAPQQVTAKYRVIKSGQVVGEVSEHFERDAQQKYRIESITNATGIFSLFARGNIRLLSAGDVTDGGLRPLHFEHHRGSDPARMIKADFDWEKSIARFSHDGKEENSALPSGTQDRISQLYQFMFQPPRGRDMEFHISNGRGLSQSRYRFIQEETITVSAGTFQTVHLSKERTRDEDGTELWLARDRHYFPVRIVFLEKNGGKLEQQLESLSLRE